MDDMLKRLKKFRKETLSLSQDEFGKRIGLSKSNVSNIEIGRVGLTDRNIKSICEAFGVNEIWLRTGGGLMFEVPASTPGELLEITGQVAAEFNTDPGKTELLLMLAKLLFTLTPEQGDIIRSYVKAVSKMDEEE